MANTSIDLVGLEFDQIKSNLKSYLKRSDSPFKDVDFEGSNISSFIDVLAYNTYLNNYYLNMVASEMFLDSAQMRDSVVSHAKELNYIPRSYRSAEADISFNITPQSELSVLVVPKGTSFTTRVGSNTFSFVTNDVIVSTANTDGKFYINTTIYEGSLFTDSFVYSSTNTSQRFVISDPSIDIRSLSVLVYENAGANVYTYTQASSYLGQSANSQIFFLQAAENNQYEIVFGDNVIGRQPAAGAGILVNYRVCNGELPNGARLFDIDGPINGQSNISSITAQPARGGAVNEDISSIKRNAVRHYQNQERAVTVNDYESLLLRNFTDIDAVSAFGGEDRDPPVYGKVFISVDVKTGTVASSQLKQKYYNFIKSRSSVSIDPVFIDPDYLYCEVYSVVRYNTGVTTLNPNDIQTLAASAVSSYNEQNLNGFKKTLRNSKLAELINQCHSSVVSCDLLVSPFKTILPLSKTIFTAVLEFGFELTSEYTISYDDVVRSQIPAVRTTTFERFGKLCFVRDDGQGVLGIYSTEGGRAEALLGVVGSVDYSSGKVSFTNLIVDSFTPASGVHMHVFVTPKERDITAVKNTFISIKDSDILIDVQALKL